MIPQRYIVLDSIPKNASMKVDRKRLVSEASVQAARMRVGDQVLDGASDTYHVPLSDNCQSMLRLWKKALQLERAECGPTTTFFSLGGDSVSSIRLVSAVRTLYPGVQFSVKDVFDNPTLEGMGGRLLKQLDTRAWDTVEVVSIAESTPISSENPDWESTTEVGRYLLKVRRSRSNNFVVCFPG